MSLYLVSRRDPCLCSSLDPDSGLFPTPALVLMTPALSLDPCQHSRSDPGLDPCQLPSPALVLGPCPSSRLGLVLCGLCPCLESMFGPGLSAPLCLCQSSRPGPDPGLSLGPRLRGLGPCWSSSSDLETTWQWREPWIQGPPHLRDHLMTSLSSWWWGSLLLLWKHSEVPHTCETKVYIYFLFKCKATEDFQLPSKSWPVMMKNSLRLSSEFS